MNLYYVINEKTENGLTTCLFITQDPLEAFADMLIKLRIPVTGGTNLNIRKRTVVSSIKANPAPINNPYCFDFLGRISDIHSNELQMKITLNTLVTEKEYNCGYHKNSNHRYFSESYDKSLTAIKNRLTSWSASDIDIARAVLFFAAINPDHLFWNEIRYHIAGYGLSF